MKVVYTLQLERHMPINPITVGYEKCDKGHNNGLTAGLEHYVIHFIFSGKGYFKNETDTYELSANDCFVIRPKEFFYYEADKEEPWFYAWIGFEENNLIPETIRKGGCIKSSELRECFLPILKVEKKSEKGFSAWICGKIFEMFQLMQQEKIYNSHVERSIIIMKNNISTPIPIGDIAKELHLDRSYFSTLFTEEVGVSPKEYYLDLRIKRAEILLSKYSLSVNKVAQATGFNDLSGFSKLFKKRIGVSPQKMRNKKNK